MGRVREVHKLSAIVILLEINSEKYEVDGGVYMSSHKVRHV